MKLTKMRQRRVDKVIKLNLDADVFVHLSDYKRRKYKDQLLWSGDLRQEYTTYAIHRIGASAVNGFRVPLRSMQEIMAKVGIEYLPVFHTTKANIRSHYILFDTPEDKLMAQLKLC